MDAAHSELVRADPGYTPPLQEPAAQPVDADAHSSDEALMQRYSQGDAKAFDTLYDRHRKQLFRFVWHQIGNRETAEEVYQDVWMNLIRSRDRYTPTARFSTFLLTIAHHRIIDHYRQRSPQIDYFDDQEPKAHIDVQRDPPIDPAEQAALNQDLRRIDDALAELSPEQREIFLLHQHANADLSELALLTGVSRETAKSRLRYALAHLRRLLGARP